jgi:hypothetical protein
MLSPIDTRILTARPDHLRPLSETERAAAALHADRRANRLSAWVDALVCCLRRPVSRRA